MEKSVETQNRLKAVIIDSHVLMRQILASMLRRKENVEIIESINLESGMSLLSMFNENEPDIIFLGIDNYKSVEMQVFGEIRRNYPRVPVVLMTPLSRAGAQIALTGLKKGAVDFITKPERNIGLVLANKHFYKRVLPIISHLSSLNMDVLKTSDSLSVSDMEVMRVTSERPNQVSNHIDIVVIGGCMGGVTSLYKLISRLPDKIPVPVVIVQHMPKHYTRELADDLDKITPLNVREAQNNSSLLPGQVYLAPGGYHTVVKNTGSRKSLFIHKGPRENHNRPSIDVLFRSAVQAYRNKVLGVLLSGGGNDGVLGANHISDAGGDIIVESEESSLLGQLSAKVLEENLSSGKYRADQLGVEIVKRLYSRPRKRVMDSKQLEH
jgi:two-component system, chemotaxis family, protein-glutamate methylesterase/glutaminase